MSFALATYSWVWNCSMCTRYSQPKDFDIVRSGFSRAILVTCMLISANNGRLHAMSQLANNKLDCKPVVGYLRALPSVVGHLPGAPRAAGGEVPAHQRAIQAAAQQLPGPVRPEGDRRADVGVPTAQRAIRLARAQVHHLAQCTGGACCAQACSDHKTKRWNARVQRIPGSLLSLPETPALGVLWCTACCLWTLNGRLNVCS